MNWLTLTFCFAATLVVVSSVRKCKNSEDCREGECCVALSVLQVRRNGVCLRLARKGGHCSEPSSEVEYYGGKYFMKYCPCQEGYSCLPRNSKVNKEDVSKYLANLRCQVSPSTSAPETTTTNPETEVTQETENPTTNPEPEVTETEPQTEETEPEPEVTTQPDDNGNDETGDETPEEIGEGPGGEPPRDDDCLDWELPC